MKRTGFTLMELLLVVAILAIVAAAAAPTFTGGASEALAEARKSAFLSAFQNITSGANIMLSVRASKGLEMVANSSLDNEDTYKNENVTPAEHALSFYVPLAARQFKNTKGETFVLGAVYDGKKVDIGYMKYTGELSSTSLKEATALTKIEITENSSTMSKVLDTTWNTIEGNSTSTSTQS